MPNGNPNFETEELPLLEAFFARISPVLESFSNTHNLLVEKYYHEGPSWSFLFKHPLGGSGQIEVEKTEDDCILLRKSWSIDDYESSTRFLKYPPGNKMGLDHTELHQSLEDALQDILQWKKDDLISHKAPYPWSKRCSKEQFYEQYEKLPDLKIKE